MIARIQNNSEVRRRDIPPSAIRCFQRGKPKSNQTRFFQTPFPFIHQLYFSSTIHHPYRQDPKSSQFNSIRTDNWKWYVASFRLIIIIILMWEYSIMDVCRAALFVITTTGGFVVNARRHAAIIAGTLLIIIIILPVVVLPFIVVFPIHSRLIIAFFLIIQKEFRRKEATWRQCLPIL